MSQRFDRDDIAAVSIFRTVVEDCSYLCSWFSAWGMITWALSMIVTVKHFIVIIIHHVGKHIFAVNGVCLGVWEGMMGIGCNRFTFGI